MVLQLIKKDMPANRLSPKGIKKGIPLYPNLVNLKSNTMKNTMQIYAVWVDLQVFCDKI